LSGTNPNRTAAIEGSSAFVMTSDFRPSISERATRDNIDAPAALELDLSCSGQPSKRSAAHPRLGEARKAAEK
jgi:hypothetical protein